MKTSSAPYILKTCAGKLETSGRRAANFTIESMDGKVKLALPPLIECDMVPDDGQKSPPQRLHTITPTYSQLLVKFHLWTKVHQSFCS